MRVFLYTIVLFFFSKCALSQEEGVYLRVEGNDSVKLILYGKMYIETGSIGLMLVKDIGTYVVKDQKIFFTSVYHESVCSIIREKDSSHYHFRIIGKKDEDDLTEMFEISIIDLPDTSNNFNHSNRNTFLVLKNPLIGEINLNLPDEILPGVYVISLIEENLPFINSAYRNEEFMLIEGVLIDKLQNEYKKIL